MLRIFRRLAPDHFAIAFLIAWPFIYFWPVTFGQGVWFSLDNLSHYYPLGMELARALENGRLPLWTTGIGAGYPLFAEGQVAALYPLNQILFRLLPAQFAISYSMLIHLAWAGVGMYLCSRTIGFREASAMLAGLGFAFSGYMIAQLCHTPVVITASWLPWLVLLQARASDANRKASPRAGIWFGLLALAIGLMFLAGHPQIALLNVLTLGTLGLVQAVAEFRVGSRLTPKDILATLLQIAIPILLGIGIAAIQLLPTAELVGQSLRGVSLGDSFNAEYSLPASFLSQFILPYSPGEPTGANLEFWGYTGLALIVLAVLAPLLRRDRRTILWGIIALVALSLSLGPLNPVYAILSQLPVFALFRVPARYLLPFTFMVALLGAAALDELSGRLNPASGRVASILLFPITSLALLPLVESESLGFWLSLWRYLPLAIALILAGLLVLCARRRVPRAVFTSTVLGLCLFDLSSYAPPFQLTINPRMAPSYVDAIPRSVAALTSLPKSGRVYTDPSVVPTYPSLRNSLNSNNVLAFGMESAQEYSPLALAKNDAFLDKLSPAMLDLMNVRYFMVPLEPRAETKRITPTDSLAMDVLDNEIVIPPTYAKQLNLVSFTERSDGVDEGTMLATVNVRRVDGTVQSFPLRVGRETADWDVERKEVQPNRVTVSSSFPAYWRSFGRTFQGHTYEMDLVLDSETQVVGIEVHQLMPQVRLAIESITLLNADGTRHSLAAMSGKNEFRVAYLSDTVAVWENQNVMPRVFIVHDAEIMDDLAALSRMKETDFRPESEVLLDTGPVLSNSNPVSSMYDRVEIVDYTPERVQLEVTVDTLGYVILADSWYPGWEAKVDGADAPIYRADVTFRAVQVEPGTSTVELVYHPESFIWGAFISLASLLSAGCASLLLNRAFLGLGRWH